MTNTSAQRRRLLRYRPGATGTAWALNGVTMPHGFTLASLLRLRFEDMLAYLDSSSDAEARPASGRALPPLEDEHEVWASGVTYRRSKVAREAEASQRGASIFYDRVFSSERPELFFKSIGWRVRGDGMDVRVRADSDWSVPEPELAVLFNAHREIVGYTASNDVSARDIEAENPLYLTQAKTYDGACALGRELFVMSEDEMLDLPINLSIERSGEVTFTGKANTSQLARAPSELGNFLFREMAFPYGVWLLTGTGIVPPDGFALRIGDTVRIEVGEAILTSLVS